MKIHCEHVDVRMVVDPSCFLCQLATPHLVEALFERQVYFVVLPRIATSITQLCCSAYDDLQPIKSVCIGVSNDAE